MKRPRARTSYIGTKIDASLDVFYSGVWWWHLRRWLALRQLAATLDRRGDRSMEARRATERCRDWEFAVTFWRPAPRLVQQAIYNAVALGVSVNDLRYVIASRALGMKKGCVGLRYSRALEIATVVISAIVVAETIALAAIALPQHIHIAQKCGVLLAVICSNLTIWRGWCLWWGRPKSAVKRWRALLERSCTDLRCGTLARLPATQATK